MKNDNELSQDLYSLYTTCPGQQLLKAAEFQYKFHLRQYVLLAFHLYPMSWHKLSTNVLFSIRVPKTSVTSESVTSQ